MKSREMRSSTNGDSTSTKRAFEDSQYTNLGPAMDQGELTFSILAFLRALVERCTHTVPTQDGEIWHPFPICQRRIVRSLPPLCGSGQNGPLTGVTFRLMTFEHCTLMPCLALCATLFGHHYNCLATVHARSAPAVSDTKRSATATKQQDERLTCFFRKHFPSRNRFEPRIFSIIES